MSDGMELEVVEESRSVSRRRRGLIAGAAALVAAALAKQGATPAAAQGDALIVGNNTGGGAQLGTFTTWLRAQVAGSPAFRSDNNIYPNTYSFDNTADGIQGYTTGASNSGIFGRNNDLNGVGTWGEAPNGTGAFGDSSAGSGVAGNSVSGAGVFGQSTSGLGVQGNSSTGTGVYGTTSGSGAFGVVGAAFANNSYGLTGVVDGSKSGCVAFLGGATGNNSAAVFNGQVVVNGPFIVSDPTNKHGAIKASDGQYHLVYSIESPEPWLEDFGEATLTNGKADVKLDPLFADVSHTNTYHVFLTVYGDQGNGLNVTQRTPNGFSVQERNKGTSNTSFSWRVVAQPKSDRKAQRLEKFTPPNVTLPDVASLPKPPTLPKRRP
jgi:hypothetical protein